MSKNNENKGRVLLILFLIWGIAYVITHISDYYKDKKKNEENKILYEKLITTFEEKKYLDFLTYEHGIYAEKIDSILWNKALKTREFQKYINYEKQLDYSYFLKHIDDAKDSIDNALWKLAKKNEDFQMYLDESEKNKIWKYKGEAEKLLKEKDSMIWSNETTAWEEAKFKDNSYVYNKFIEKFPNSLYINTAKNLAIKREVDEIFNDKSTGVLPSFEKNSYGKSSFSTVSITNDTGCPLTIWYSGNILEKFIINEGETHMIKLRSGNYRVAASACGARYAGAEYLSGEYSSTFYIRTVRY